MSPEPQQLIPARAARRAPRKGARGGQTERQPSAARPSWGAAGGPRHPGRRPRPGWGLPADPVASQRCRAPIPPCFVGNGVPGAWSGGEWEAPGSEQPPPRGWAGAGKGFKTDATSWGRGMGCGAVGLFLSDPGVGGLGGQRCPPGRCRDPCPGALRQHGGLAGEGSRNGSSAVPSAGRRAVPHNKKPASSSARGGSPGGFWTSSAMAPSDVPAPPRAARAVPGSWPLSGSATGRAGLGSCVQPSSCPRVWGAFWE